MFCCTFYFFLVQSWEIRTLLRICSFLLGCSFYWHTVACSNLLQSFVLLWCNVFFFISNFTDLHPLPFFLDESGLLLLFSRSVVSGSLQPMDCNTPGLLKLMSIELVIPPNHLILCHSLLLQPPIFPSIRVSSSRHIAKVLELQLQHQSF